jgi:threonine dehydratase
VVVSGADAGSPTARPDIQRQRRPVPTVVTVAVATGLLSAGFIRVFEPAANHRVLSMGVYLIGAAAAVRSVERVQHQRSQIASMSPDLTIRRSNDE